MSRDQVVAVLLGVIATRFYLWLRHRLRDRVDAPVHLTETRPLTVDELRPGRRALVDEAGRAWHVLRVTHTRGTGDRSEGIVVEFTPTPKEP